MVCADPGHDALNCGGNDLRHLTLLTDVAFFGGDA
jgi:hypothetical protein